MRTTSPNPVTPNSPTSSATPTAFTASRSTPASTARTSAKPGSAGRGPPHFRFAVKLPKSITHTAKLRNCGALLQTFLDQATGLGHKLGTLLIQLPPSLAFDEGLAHEFLTTLRELHPSNTDLSKPNLAALEPRHASWFTPAADRLLRSFDIARVAADPPKGSPLAATPGGSQHLQYYRLHGAPRTYYSDYADPQLATLAHTLQATPADTNLWVIFDNTALGHATANALHLAALLQDQDPHAPRP
jgi:uncharacterized protein YecE (DUF72 family)